MKITKLTTYIVPPRWLFLKIETDEGIVGWGEPVVEGRALTVEAAVHELSDYLVGKDPFLIEDHWNVLYRGGFYRGGAIHMSALAGIDQALWDIKGKALGQPVHSLLGGQCRDRIKVYSWIGGDRPSDVANNAREVVARGFKAIKLNGCEEMQIVDTNEKIDKAVETIGLIRDAIGPHVGIGVDFHGRVHRPMAKVLAKELEQFKLMFIEEPVLSENREALREIANHCSTPIALGERLYSLGLQIGSLRRLRRHHPAGSFPCRRDHRMPQDRRDGRGLRRSAGAALPPRADCACRVPAGRCGQL